MAGIYIHIPYCRKACHYCNFHFSTRLRSKDQLVKNIIKEISFRSDELVLEDGAIPTIETIYFGGGTPSLLTIDELSSILQAINNDYKIKSDAEVTLEANPEDITASILLEWFQVGINRLSIGIQSFLDKDLVYMNRAHEALQSCQALRLINQSKISNVNADLMFGLVNSSICDWRYNLDKVLSYNITHLSIYNLTIEEQTVFYNWKSKNQLKEVSLDLQEEQFNMAHHYLKDKGYDHYEISNYALSGHHAIHNTNYWNKVPYIGFGPAAHSYLGHIRKWNVSNNATYIKMWNDNTYESSSEELDKYEQYNELIMLGLRTKQGILKKNLEHFPVEIISYFKRECQQLIENGVLIESEQCISLDFKHWYLSDHIAKQLFIVS